MKRSGSFGEGEGEGLSGGEGEAGGEGEGEGLSGGEGEGEGEGGGEGGGGGGAVIVQTGGRGSSPRRRSRTGAGMSSGDGFAGGYGRIRRSAYATPIELDFKPWTPEFYTEDGKSAYPNDWLNPYPTETDKGNWLHWRMQDWDPGLRFWSLGLDPRLTEWLQDVDLAAPSAMAAREFAMQHAHWTHEAPDGKLASQIALLLRSGWLADGDVKWWPRSKVTIPPSAGFTTPFVSPGVLHNEAWAEIQRELGVLIDHMEESRARYMQEIRAQADGIPRHFMHLLGMDRTSKPWTVHLIRCGLAIGNVAYMYFKARFGRVRPSYLCPGLLPNFGPPRHPAFPSGHSFLGHLIALLLLEIPDIQSRYGIEMGGPPPGSTNGPQGKKPRWSEVRSDKPLPGPLFWLANRLAVNRERLGVHYPSDSRAGRHLAGGIWHAAFVEKKTDPSFESVLEIPTLRLVLARAKAEWE